MTVCRTDGQKTLYWTENRAHDSSESVKRVIPKITSWKLRRARAPVPHSWRRQWSHVCVCVCVVEQPAHVIEQHLNDTLPLRLSQSLQVTIPTLWAGRGGQSPTQNWRSLSLVDWIVSHVSHSVEVHIFYVELKTAVHLCTKRAVICGCKHTCAEA